jgi:hypothetical protein
MSTMPNPKHHYHQLPYSYPTPRVLGSPSFWSNQHLSSSYQSTSSFPRFMPSDSLPNGSLAGRLAMSGDDQPDDPSYPLNTHSQSNISSPYLSGSSVPPVPNNSLPNGSQGGRLIISSNGPTDQPSYTLNTNTQPNQDFFWPSAPNGYDADVNLGPAVQLQYNNWRQPYTSSSEPLRDLSAYPRTQNYPSTPPSQISTYPSQSSTYTGTSPAYPRQSPTFSSASPTYSGQSPNYSHPQPQTPINQTSAGSNEQLSPSYTNSSTPTTPASSSSFASTSPLNIHPSLQPVPEKRLYSHREQLIFFRQVLDLPMRAYGPFVPQQMYKPHTNSDRKRYVEEIELEAPIYFSMDHPSEFGIPLSDALHSRVKRLQNRDQLVFEGRGPSVSIRLEWPGYRQWSRQIPTKDFRTPPGPITLSKLAKNVAKCVQRFIEERKNQSLEDDSDPRWKVGTGANHIKLEDLVLVSIHHVSLGSWQPQLRLNHQHPASS